MRGENLHNTLVFIGHVEQSRLEALQLAAREVSAEDFELCLDGARYWGHNHIVYATPSHVPSHLVQLAGALERHLTAHRFKFDQREYKPHVTLLRNVSLDRCAIARDASGALADTGFRAGAIRE